MKKNSWFIPDLVLAAVYVMIFLAVFDMRLPAAVWVSLGFFLLSHVLFWVWMTVQPGHSHQYTGAWTMAMPCLAYILLEAVLGIVFAVLAPSMKTVLVTHAALLLLSLGICRMVHSANQADAGTGQ